MTLAEPMVGDMTAIRWRKLGLVFAADATRPWSRSHAQVPTPLLLGDRIRVFYSTRNADNRTSTGFFDVATDDPTRVIHDHATPVLGPSRPGGFDDCGAMACAAVHLGDEVYLYYLGWNVRTTVPFHNAIGLAVSRDEATTFTRISAGPLLDRSTVDPYFCATAGVLRGDDGPQGSARWRMWYASGTEWRPAGDTLEPRYLIKYAESTDGIAWDRDGAVAIDYASDDEGGLVRPAVCHDADGWRMWYSRRAWRGYRDGDAGGYRIGYAESADGRTWVRRDADAGIDVSDEGWDAGMIEYPAVVDVGAARYLFYNGNSFGRDGIGVAVAE
jgi:hypothetical protein